MQRSAWIFLSAILLPSLGLAWLAIHSVRDQQVVVQHQEAIICQNLTDTLAKNIQDQMDRVRQDFVRATAQLLTISASPGELASNFNLRLHPAWPLAEIGFAVDLDGRIYSPQVRDGLPAQKFRDENDRFLSNRENAEVYFYNGINASSNAMTTSNINPLPGNDRVTSGQAIFSGTHASESTAPAGRASFDLPDQNQKLARLATAADTAAASAPASTLPPPPDMPVVTSKPLNAPSSGAGQSDYSTAALQDEEADAAKTLGQKKQQEQEKTKDTAAGQLKRRDETVNSRGKTVILGQVTAAPAAAPAAPPPPYAPAATRALKSASALPPETGSTPAAPSAASTATATIDSIDDGQPRSQPPADKATLRKELELAKASAPPASPPAPAPTLTYAPPPAPAEAQANTLSSDSLKAVMPAPDKAQQAEVGGLTPTTPVPDAAQSIPSTQGGSSLNTFSNIVQQKMQRKVIPQQQLAQSEQATLSNTVPAESDFRQVIGSETSGSLARILENKLCLMVWSHTPADSPIVFGAQLDQAQLVDTLKSSFQIPDATSSNLSSAPTSNYCLAILDDNGHPVALSRAGFTADWKHPFVATELGDVLPHWEAALYLIDPHQIDRTAHTLQLTLGLIVLLLVAAIVAGGSLIAGDVRRQVRLAQQKTDFVSNVSHELKTPLTSIRMFADLLAEKRVPDEQKQSTYLRIIAAEAARLTRLINNVLDFARLERGAPPGEHHACDLVDAVRDVIETCQPHLETSGIAFHSEIETEKLPLNGDRDALAQIILNLVSNAEKYGGNDITVRVRRQETPAGALGCVDVMDRGAGISPKDMKTIFEPFHRLDDSLASGIPGSGLGLTLSRRMARAHGGDVTCSARAGGGTCFTLSVPLTQSKSQ